MRRQAAIMIPALFVLSFMPSGRATRAEAAADVQVDLGFHAGNADVDFFYDALAPYGDWMEMQPYGWVWAPRSVDAGWRPYRNGHWVYTDYDWTWVSDEPWGWAPFHYGRWTVDSRYGWVWVPGSVWAPAWVSWRYGDDYAGWAPLPPDADVALGQASFGIDPLAYCFVPARYLTEPVLTSHYVPAARNVTIVNVTRNVTNYTVVDNRVVNQGVQLAEVEKATGRAVPRARIAEAAAPAPTRVRGNEVAIYKPPVPAAKGQPTRPARAQAGRAAPAPPTPNPATGRELRERQQQEQQHLAQEQARERTELQQEHAREKASPPPSVSRQELAARQRAEQQAQARHEDREKRMLDDRQARQRQPAEGQKVQHHEEKRPPQPPPPRDEKAKEKKPKETKPGEDKS